MADELYDWISMLSIFEGTGWPILNCYVALFPEKSILLNSNYPLWRASKYNVEVVSPNIEW